MQVMGCFVLWYCQNHRKEGEKVTVLLDFLNFTYAHAHKVTACSIHSNAREQSSCARKLFPVHASQMLASYETRLRATLVEKKAPASSSC